MKYLKEVLNNVLTFIKKNKSNLFILLIVLALGMLLTGAQFVSTFEDGKEDVVYGVAKGSKNKDEWKDMSSDDCKQIAEDSDGKYIAWGHHGEDHDDEDKRNSCFMYTKIKPYKGDKDNEVSFMACTDPSLSILNGCKASTPDGKEEEEESDDEDEETKALEELLEDL